MDLKIDGNKRLLGRVLSQMKVAEHRECIAEGKALMLFDQVGKSLPVTLCAPFDQCSNIHTHHNDVACYQSSANFPEKVLQ